MRSSTLLAVLILAGAGPATTRPAHPATVPAVTLAWDFSVLRRRLEQGHVDDARVGPLVDRLLAAQADAAEPWSPSYGELLLTLHDQRRLTPAQWARFEQHIVTFTLRVRPRVRRSDPIPAELMVSPRRAGQDHAEDGPVRVSLAVPDGTTWVVYPRADEPQARAFHTTLPEGQTLGRHTVTLGLHYGVRRGYTDDPPPEARGESTLSADLTVVPDDQDTVTAADPAFIDTLKRTLWFGGNPGSALGHVHVIPRQDRPWPGSYRFTAVARQGGQERPLGAFRTVKGGGCVEPHDVDLSGLHQTEMTPVVRSPAALARDTVDQTMYLPGEVELRGPISLYR